MNAGIDLFIGKGQIVLCDVKQTGSNVEFAQSPAEFAQQFSAFSKQHASLAGRRITIYLSDDLLYFTRIKLPKQTPDIKKALKLQMDIISPFGENCLYAYDIQRGKDATHVALYLTDQRIILPILETIVGMGHHIYGMYPESQRGLSSKNRKKNWGLMSQGLFNKLTIFEAGHVTERLQLSGQPDQNLLNKTYDLEFTQDITDLSAKPSPPGAPLGFDLLPKTFRRTDYGKWLLLSLLTLNLLLALGWLGMNFFSLQNQINQIENFRQKMAPQLSELKKLNKQQARQSLKLQSYANIGKNKNLLSLLSNLSQNLPITSHLDQLRLDKKTGAIHIQGYTSNLGALTTSLQAIGNATLESTHKRRNQTYFKIEVLPK